MFYEIARFPEQLVRALQGSTLTLKGVEYLVHGVLYLPFAPEDWERIRRYSEVAGDGKVAISSFWAARSRHFLYIYSIEQKMLAISGYFNSGYTGNYLEGALQNFVRPPINELQRDLFKSFIKDAGPLVRSWYPLLPSLIDHYDISKNLDVGRAIAANLTADQSAALRVLEIGAGGCLMPLFLRHLTTLRSYDVVDLDFVLPFGFAMLRCFAPELPVALPNELATDAIVRFHENNAPPTFTASHDVAINITSFGEMTNRNVADYFTLIDGALPSGGVFACINRREKMTRFEDYPWHLVDGDILIDAVDPTSGYYDPDPIYRRIVRKR
jgi:hypothetical protein